MRRLLFLAALSMVAVLMFASVAVAQTYDYSSGAAAPAPQQQPAAPTYTAPQQQVTQMPATGGPSLLLPAGALLVGSGSLLGLVALRRRTS